MRPKRRGRFVSKRDFASGKPGQACCQPFFCVAMPHRQSAVSCQGKPPTGRSTGFTGQTKFDQMVFDLMDIATSGNEVVL
ncbi:MAG: hypothetical protein KA781_04310, partial [Aquabacterium sp.]|nr:hypothetical protein [Aquabacterium sp.]